MKTHIFAVALLVLLVPPGSYTPRVSDALTDGRIRFSGSGTTLRGWIDSSGTLVWPDFAVVHAQEKVTLASPVFVSAGAAEFRVWDLYVRRTHPDREAEVRATFREVTGAGFVPGGRSLECRYEGEVAETLVIALNKANLSTASLEKRVTQRCQTDGKLGAGSISGVPQ